MSGIRKILREPLAHFFALAALLFLVDWVFSATQKTRIVIDQQTVDYLVRQREELMLRALSADERSEVVQGFIEDEILYQEAYRRGLDRGDSRMRRNLILKMRGLLAGEVGQPDAAELRAYFGANRERFSRPASLDLTYIRFAASTEVPDRFLERLRDPDAAARHPEGARTLRATTGNYLAGAFGPAAAGAVLALPDDEWHGPLESRDGTLFVRITGHNPAVAADYEAVESYVRSDWLINRAQQVIREEVDRLRPDYEIVVENSS